MDHRHAIIIAGLALAGACQAQDSFLNPYRYAGAAALTAPTFVRTATNGASSGASLTITGFSVTGSNPYLLVFVNERSSLSLKTITSVTANGAGMANLVQTNWTDAKGLCAIYGLANPTTGDIVVTLSATINTTFTVNAILFNGCATTGAAAADFAAAGRTSVSVTPASVATDLVADGEFGALWAPGGAQTQRATATPSAGAFSTSLGSAGTTTMSWSGASTTISQLAIVLHGL